VELLEWGYFSRTHGLKGELLLRASRQANIRKIRTVFVEMAGSKAPHFVTSLRESEKGIIVAMEDVSSVSAAGKLAGKKVFVQSEFLREEKKDNDLSGFELIDEQLGSLGRIGSVEETGAQVLVSLQHKGREILLPLADALVKKIDKKKKIVYYAAPPGLIEIYLTDSD
jgi:16S rRNA processing protein RimM